MRVRVHCELVECKESERTARTNPTAQTIRIEEESNTSERLRGAGNEAQTAHNKWCS